MDDKVKPPSLELQPRHLRGVPAYRRHAARGNAIFRAFNRRTTCF